MRSVVNGDKTMPLSFIDRVSARLGFLWSLSPYAEEVRRTGQLNCTVAAQSNSPHRKFKCLVFLFKPLTNLLMFLVHSHVENRQYQDRIV